jgi:hypothetical protein
MIPLRIGRFGGALLVLFACLLWAPRDGAGAAEQDAEDGLPLISRMTQDEEEEKTEEEEEEEAVYPPNLSARVGVYEAVDLLPQGAFVYLEARSGEGLLEKLDQTAAAGLLQEKSVQRFISTNKFGLDSLLTDLPDGWDSPQAVEAGALVGRIVSAFAGADGQLALAAYPASTGDLPVVVFLASIGTERREPYERLEALLLDHLGQAPGLHRRPGDHSGDYADVIRLSHDRFRAELACGIIHNFVFVATEQAFAQSLLDRLAGTAGRNSLAEGRAFADLAQRTPADSIIRGFLDLEGILRASRRSNLSRARNWAELASDVGHRGVIYYDLRPEGEALLEHFTMPALPGAGMVTLGARLALVGDRQASVGAADLDGPAVMPYQPLSYIAMHVKPVELQALLNKRTIFGSSPLSAQLSRSLPSTVVRIFNAVGAQADTLLTGEVGISLVSNARRARGYDWLMALPLRNAKKTREAIAATGRPFKILGIEIHNAAGTPEPEQPAWAVLESGGGYLRNLPRSFLVVASSGAAMRAALDRVVGGGATLAQNDDFITQMDRIGEVGVLGLYDNMPQSIQIGYHTKVRSFLRASFPQIGNIRAIPPLRDVNRHIFGVAAGVTLPEEGMLRFSYRSPTGFLPTGAVQGLLTLPQWLREREEEALREARTSLGNLSLALQEYATQYGHFPKSLATEADRQQLNMLLPERLDANRLLINPGALLRLRDRDLALRRSYTYVPGLLPSDLAEEIILYTSKPWHYHYRTNRRKTYEPCRLVLHLNGHIEEYSEDVFQKRVLPRIRNRR